MSNTNVVTTTQAAPADTPQPAPTPTMTPEAVVDALRALRAQIGDTTPLTTGQRKAVRSRARASNPVLQASINVIGALDNVAQAIGQPAADVRQMYDEANRWTAVEDEMRSMLNGISSANLIRRQRIALIAAQAATIGSQLVRDPANAVLVPHMQELNRLKSFTRRKKPAQAPGTSEPPASGTTSSASGTPQSSASGTSQTAAPGTPVSQGAGTSASHQA
jgi:hypothetical protein